MGLCRHGLIYGDLSDMLNEDNFSKYNFISTHSDRVDGHLTVIWKEKLEMEEFHGLDEEPDYGQIMHTIYKLCLSALLQIFFSIKTVTDILILRSMCSSRCIEIRYSKNDTQLQYLGRRLHIIMI